MLSVADVLCTAGGLQRLLQAQNAALEEEHRAHGVQQGAKQAEIELLRFELNQSTRRTHKLSELLGR